MRSEIKTERATIIRLREKSTIKRTITILKGRLAESQRFYPWPALQHSWQQDIEMLEARLAAIPE